MLFLVVFFAASIFIATFAFPFPLLRKCVFRNLLFHKNINVMSKVKIDLEHLRRRALGLAVDSCGIRLSGRYASGREGGGPAGMTEFV